MQQRSDLRKANPGKIGIIPDFSQQLNLQYSQLEAHFDPIYRVLWCTLKSMPMPAFTPTLVENIRALQDDVAQFARDNPGRQPKYMVWLSDNPKVFSTGLDLTHIHQLISSGNEEGLDQYLQTCIDIFVINLLRLDIAPMITLCLIRGKAYGGGFEAALTCDIVIAEKNARCCFPEIRYNLLPPLGACHILLKNFSQALFQPLLLQGKHLPLEDLAQHGIIDSIVDLGGGKTAIQEKIQQLNTRHELFATLYANKMRENFLPYEEFEKFKKDWIHAAFNLNKHDLARLARLARAQKNWLNLPFNE